MKLDIESHDQSKELQMAVVSFDVKGAGWVMWYHGKGIECDIENVGTSADDLGLTDKTSPDHGIWIWQGHFHYWQDYEGECDVDVRTKEWRKPNAAEWHAIMSGRDPFDLYYFMRPEGKKITTTKPNLNDDLFKKEMVAEAWKPAFFKMEGRDQILSKMIEQDRGRACPKCSGSMQNNRCTECGFSK